MLQLDFLIDSLNFICFKILTKIFFKDIYEKIYRKITRTSPTRRLKTL